MPGFRFVSSHADTDDAIAHLPVNRVDVVLVDIGLRGASGIECLRGLKRRKPGIHVIMFTVHDDSDRIFDSLRSGASGYILKSSVPTEILDAIREVVNGGAPMTPPVARRVLQHFHRSSDAKAGLEQLTNREGEVLHHLSAGYTAKEIAEILHISFETVRNHIKSIYAKLQVGSRAEAVVKYLGH
jgi:DNA-binding NarL/FixJ family response regulator